MLANGIHISRLTIDYVVDIGVDLDPGKLFVIFEHAFVLFKVT